MPKQCKETEEVVKKCTTMNSKTKQYETLLKIARIEKNTENATDM